MKAVNLLPPDRRDSGHKRSSAFAPIASRPLLSVAVALALVVAGTLGMLARSASSDVAASRSELASVQATLAQLAKPKQPLLPPAEAADANARLRAATAAATGRVQWDGVLTSISRVLPEDVWLDNMSLASAAASVPPTVGEAATSGFTISGYTYSHPSVARLMRRLALVPWLTNVSLGSSDRTQIDERTVYKFTVGAGIQNVEVHP